MKKGLLMQLLKNMKEQVGFGNHFYFLKNSYII